MNPLSLLVAALAFYSACSHSLHERSKESLKNLREAKDFNTNTADLFSLKETNMPTKGGGKGGSELITDDAPRLFLIDSLP